ncbi:MAG TPA: serine hydrolase domain-containing protein [Longimicrobiales bacterium]|nr:serine hydrolase domain-containing protein [Longimicrobiales bacterium]
MWNLRRLSALPLFLALLVSTPLSAQELPNVTPESVGMSSERLDRLTAALEEYVEHGRLAGAAAIVLRDGNVVYDEAVGYRDREANAQMTTDAIFRIASQTKAIVSTGILMLQEEGKLLISHPVSRYLPAFRGTTVAEPREGGGYDVVAAERPITLRHLLTHTAGIGYGSGPGGDRWEAAGITGWYFGHRDEPVQETVSRMASLPFQAQPGEAFVYGYNTDILGAVIEVVSGQPLDAFLSERILEPLGMRDTHFYLPPAKRGRLATVYGYTGALARAPDGPGMQTQGQYVDGPRRSFSGGAGLLSTTRDYARFLQMMLNGGELNGVRLLSPTTVDLMTQNHIPHIDRGPGGGFGLGFSIRTDVGAAGQPGSVGEFGWGGAYHSTYWADPVEDLVVVYLTQVIPAQGLDDQAKLRALVYASITESRGGADGMHAAMHSATR